LGLTAGTSVGKDSRLNAGLARRIDDDLDTYSGLNGFIDERIRYGGIYDRRLLDLSKRISDMEDRLAAYETSLRQQYANLETALSRYETTRQFIANQTAQLTSGSTTGTVTGGGFTIG
jgi:flagellar capping protein FliD